MSCSPQVLSQMTPQNVSEIDALLGNKPHSKKESRAWGNETIGEILAAGQRQGKRTRERLNAASHRFSALPYITTPACLLQPAFCPYRTALCNPTQISKHTYKQNERTAVSNLAGMRRTRSFFTWRDQSFVFQEEVLQKEETKEANDNFVTPLGPFLHQWTSCFERACVNWGMNECLYVCMQWHFESNSIAGAHLKKRTARLAVWTARQPLDVARCLRKLLVAFVGTRAVCRGAKEHGGLSGVWQEHAATADGWLDTSQVFLRFPPFHLSLCLQWCTCPFKRICAVVGGVCVRVCVVPRKHVHSQFLIYQKMKHWNSLFECDIVIQWPENAFGRHTSNHMDLIVFNRSLKSIFWRLVKCVVHSVIC